MKTQVCFLIHSIGRGTIDNFTIFVTGTISTPCIPRAGEKISVKRWGNDFAEYGENPLTAMTVDNFNSFTVTSVDFLALQPGVMTPRINIEVNCDLTMQKANIEGDINGMKWLLTKSLTVILGQETPDHITSLGVEVHTPYTGERADSLLEEIIKHFPVD